MATEGRLGPGGVADLLSAAWEQERTGILDVSAGGADRKLVLSGGDVVYLTSSEALEKLPLWLVARGAVSREALIAASKASPDLREALETAGALAPEAHDRELRALIADVVTRIFALTDGKYSLVDKSELTIGGLLPANPMIPILWRAARACPPGFASAFLGDVGQRILKTGGDDLLGEIPDMSPQEGYLLSRIDGYCSVQDLVGMSPLPTEETHRLLVGLTCIGLLDVQGRPTVRLPKPAKVGTRLAKKKAAPAATGRASASGGAAAAGGAAAMAAAAPLILEGIDAARDALLRTAEANFYGVLGVAQAASMAEIRKAYYAMALDYHPDRFGKEVGESDRQVVEDLFARISGAFSTLSSDEKRKEYDEKLRSGALLLEKQEKAPVDKKQLARESFDKARALLAGGDRSRALGFLEHAVDTDQDNWDYRMALGKFFLGDGRLRRKAEPQFLEAIRIDQSKADAYWQLGVLYKAAGVKSRAIQKLREGLNWDPAHAGIKKELAELGS